MSLFASVAEARDIGLKLLALHRAALGRDPSEDGLETLVRRWRAGSTARVIARDLLATPECRARADAPADLGSLLARAVPVAPGDAFPALFADCDPDDPIAYRFWLGARHEVDGGSATQEDATPPVHLFVLVGDAEAERVAPTVRSLLAQTRPAASVTLVLRLLSRWAKQEVASLPADARLARLEIGIDETGSGADLLPDPRAFAGIARAGDGVTPDAVAALAACLAAHPDTRLIYTDEDRMDRHGRRSRPRFKPGVPDADGPGALTLMRSDLLAETPGDPFAPEFVNEALARAGTRVRHLPRILYHRADAPPRFVPAPAPPPAQRPSVSIIIVSRTPDLLETVLRGIAEETDYARPEVIVVDHGGHHRRAADRRIPWTDAFNFAAMNNEAARHASGDLLVLLNDDIRIIDRTWLATLAGHASAPEVGVVGARLLFPDGTLQHGGIALGPGGTATHLMTGAGTEEAGYLDLLARTRDVAAVTGACLAVRREVWTRVGGMEERLPVAWNDIDLCQRARAAGLRVVWTPDATLVHLEARTRGRDSTPEKIAAFERDRALYRSLWGERAETDPFVNPNLAVTPRRLCLGPVRAR